MDMEWWQFFGLWFIIVMQALQVFACVVRASKGKYTKVETPGVNAADAALGTLMFVLLLTLAL